MFPYTEEKAHMRHSFQIGPLGCSKSDATCKKQFYVLTCSHSTWLSSTENILELAGPQRARDNTY